MSNTIGTDTQSKIVRAYRLLTGKPLTGPTMLCPGALILAECVENVGLLESRYTNLRELLIRLGYTPRRLEEIERGQL